VEVQLGDDGRPVLGRVTHQDITELHVAERDPRRGQACLQAVLAATPDDIVVTDVASGVSADYRSRHADGKDRVEIVEQPAAEGPRASSA